MFLWLNNEVAIYVKLEEGNKICLRELLEMLKHINIDLSEFFEQAERRIIHDHDFMVTFNYSPITADSKVFDEQSTFNLQFLNGDY